MTITQQLKRLRRRWCHWRGHEFVKDRLCISEYGTPNLVNGVVVPGICYEVWSMKCGRHG